MKALSVLRHPDFSVHGRGGFTFDAVIVTVFLITSVVVAVVSVMSLPNMSKAVTFAVVSLITLCAAGSNAVAVLRNHYQHLLQRSVTPAN